MESQEERLIAAAQAGEATTLQNLLAAGAEVNAQGEVGMTALMHAARNNAVECVKVLLAAGAEVNTANEFGRTALIMAREKGHTEAMQLLQNAGAVERPQSHSAVSQTASPDRLTATAAQYGFEDQVVSAAKWFFWIAGLSLVNSLILLAEGKWSFIIGLGITQVIDTIAVSVAADSETGLGIFIKSAALFADLIIIGVVIAFGVFAKKMQKWSFITGMTLYALDGLILVLAKDLVGIGFHLFVLWMLYSGLKALNEFGETGESKPASVPAVR
ncbi:MAG: hypothetical protein ALAOOOJD_04582 [bacterium]|nr:hypothetical protein [bacterium]